MPLAGMDLLSTIQLHRKRAEFAERVVDRCLGCTNGRVPITSEDGDSYSVFCPLLSRECKYGKSLLDRRERGLRSAVLQADIPTVHRRGITKPRQTLAIQLVRTWNWRDRPFLVLLGEKGVGKSFAAAYSYVRWARSFLREEDWQRENSWNEVYRVARESLTWLHVYEIVNDIEARKKAIYSPFVVIDDLSTEDASATAKSRINYVISKRYDMQRPMVITANLTYQDLRDRYGARILDRLKQSGTIEQCSGQNQRANW